MPHCVIKSCKNYPSKVGKEDGVSYFHFPRDPIRCSLWKNIIAKSRQEEYFNPKKSNLVCSNHFTESDMYTTNKGLRRLKKTAVPTVLLNYEDNTSQNAKYGETTVTSTLTMDNAVSSVLTQEFEKPITDVFAQEQITSQNSPTTSISIGSILDTPRKILLKKDLQSCKKQILVKNRKINNLQKVNKRLKKKNITLKNALNLLKKRKGIEESLLQDLSQHLEITDTFNALYLKNVKNNKRPFAKYPPGARKFAITLHFYSPAAYKYLRRMLNSCLPHPSTLYEWYRSVEAEPGFTAETLDRLKEKSKTTDLL